jgi:hypothetical protein
MTDHIDNQVAEFAAEIEDLAILDVDQTHADVTALTAAVVNAATHDAAAVAVRAFYDSRDANPDYARSVILGAIVGVTLHVACTAPMVDVRGAEGLSARLVRVIYAVRGLGIAAPSGVFTFGGDR